MPRLQRTCRGDITAVETMQKHGNNSSEVPQSGESAASALQHSILRPKTLVLASWSKSKEEGITLYITFVPYDTDKCPHG